MTTPRPIANPIMVFDCTESEAREFREESARRGIPVLLTADPLTEATAAQAYGRRCVSVGHRNRISNQTLHELSKVGVIYISTRSVGFDHIDVDYAAQVGICVENVPYSPASVADYTLMLILMVLRHAKPVLLRAEAHDFNMTSPRGRELRDLTVGVIGTGRIGSAVVDRLEGFGCRILIHTRQPVTDERHVSLDEILRRSDVVTLHTPLNAETHHLLNRERIAQLPSGALIVNTGRGALIDTEALLSALESGHVSGAALDVLEGEGRYFHGDHETHVPEDGLLFRLQKMPNVIITPHIAFFTDHALADTVRNGLARCIAFDKGN
ncbi:hypothetical protein APU90_04815 [Rathayibacter toxicus]|nr:NAD(P)-dependent oxidoreductase [Rathayibacter toxicus]AJM77024.1 hypothetical protein TI83_01675 [Rathayibacter toxicus]ALS57172.1 hypothetical protein APU90_04815 [Rathayibacter toxicus]KKM46024.1 hypothetical protein VT73_02690 [Rathayibacter toxicus]